MLWRQGTAQRLRSVLWSPDPLRPGPCVGRSTLEVHLQSVNESLRQIAIDYFSRVEAPGQSLTSRVRQALRHTLGSTGRKKTDVADLLGMHPRTLQRHLKADGTTD